MGEIHVLASYAVTRHVAVRGGYEMLWIDHVALASDQAAAATANQTQDAISATADFFTYGATVGMDVTCEVSWAVERSRRAANSTRSR